MADKIIIDGQELEDVNGGYGGAGFYMTVGDCGGGYLALRPQPVWDQYHEIAKLYPGYEVFTYGSTTRGTGLNGVPCSYTYVMFNGNWGWANSAFLRKYRWFERYSPFKPPVFFPPVRLPCLAPILCDSSQ